MTIRIRKLNVWGWIWFIAGALYFFLPLIATFEFSLRAKKGVLSLLAYQRVLQDPQFVRTFSFSIGMGVLTILASLILIAPTAYWIRLRLPQLRPVVEFITTMPFVIPAIVLVFGMIRVYSGGLLPLTNTVIGTDVLLVAAYMVLALPYMYRAVDTGLAAIDVRTLTEAAQSLGAGWGTILFRVIFPNLRGALLSGAFLTFAMVIGEFTIASFLVGMNAFGPYMSQVGQNKAYESASLAIISFGLTWAFMGLIQLFNRGAEQSQVVGSTLRTDRSHVVSHAHRHLQDLQRHGRGRGFQPGRAARGVRLVPGSQRLRQDDHAAHDRRVRDAHHRYYRDQRRGHHLSAAQPAQRRHGVPVLCALPQHDGGGEHRFRPQSDQDAGRRDPEDRGRDAGCHPPAGARCALPLSAFRWPAAAGRAGACAGHPSQGVAARRAALGAGRQDPGGARAAKSAASSRSWGSPRST